MHSLLLISYFSVVAVVARAEQPLSYFVRHQRSLPSNVQSGKMSAYHYGIPASKYSAPSHNSLEHNAYDMAGHKEDTYNAAYRHSSTQHQSGYANSPTETQIHKHIYVHAPPKDFEDEDMTPRVTHQVAPKQKHYKIVFIKSPSAPAVRPPVVPPTPQNEEKTLIYVLHKKAEAQPDVVIPTPAPTKPSKPEVYFIKYKTKKDKSPVYGPPPATYGAQARTAIEPSGKYGAPLSNDVNDFGSHDLSQNQAQITTPQPTIIEQSQTPQFISEKRSDQSYSAPSISGDQVPTTAANSSPQTTFAPIVVVEMDDQPRAPAIRRGPPSRNSRYSSRHSQS